jgi:hypothetical protein
MSATKHRCVNCHFLVKRYRDHDPPITISVSATERTKVTSGDFSWADRGSPAICCSLGVWDEGVPGFERDRMQEIITKDDRKGYCFFWDYRPGMLIPAAKELEERQSEREKSNRDHRFALVGLWIAALALFAQVVLSIMDLWKG